MPMDIEVDTPFGRGRVIVAGRYHDGSVALRVVGDSARMAEPIGTLTVCVSQGPLPDGFFLVKTWSENEELAASLLAQGVFVDTGVRVPTGHVEASVWALPEALSSGASEQS